MLGVDRGYQGVHLGSNLLLDAVQRAGAVSSSIGARALVVDPADEASRAFYAHHGFRDIPQSQRMFAKLL
jgi:ribosomal protein S18 acetylase RimI-like enzyme